MHSGVDFAAAEGIPVYSAENGKVTEVSIKETGYGKSIVIEHKNNIKTRYAHLSKILVRHKQIIKNGDIIGLVGSSGNTRGSFGASHLHFEVIINKKKLNPALYIKNHTK